MGWNMPVNGLPSAFVPLCVAIASLVLAGCQGGQAELSASSTQSFAQVGDTDGDLRVVAELPPPPEALGGGNNQIAENDLLQIDVFQVDSLDRTARVDSRGNVSMPLIGQIRAAGLTVPEFEEQLETRYSVDYLQSPEITVFVEESFGQRVTMDGEFRRPGVLSVTAQTTLLQAVAQAGGLSDIANERRVFVFRDMGTGKMVASYSLADIRTGNARDPRIYGGDVVVAFASGSRIAARNLREALGIATSTATLAAPL